MLILCVIGRGPSSTRATTRAVAGGTADNLQREGADLEAERRQRAEIRRALDLAVLAVDADMVRRLEDVGAPRRLRSRACTGSATSQPQVSIPINFTPWSISQRLAAALIPAPCVK